MLKSELVSSLLKTIDELNETIVTLNARIEELTAKLNENSSNSNYPSSRDLYPPVKKDISFRKKSDKKVGGQPNHPGKTRLLVNISLK